MGEARGRNVGVTGTILVVDDDPDVRAVIADGLLSLGYAVRTAASAEDALTTLEKTPPDLVLTDVHMGAMSGVELAGLAAGADDFFAKPFELLELRARVGTLLRVKTLVDQLERAENVITTLGSTIEARDPYTDGHCERLVESADTLGRVLGAPDSLRRALRLGR